MSAAAAHLARGVGRLTDLTFTKGAGARVATACGRNLLDMTCGIGVVNTGHCHSRIAAAAAAQCGKLVHAQANIAYHEPMLDLIEELKPSMPHPSLDTFFFATTGAEGVENAVKLCRHATGRPNVIVFQGGYHGRTALTMGMTTSSTIYSAGFGPFPPGIHVAPFPYELHGVSVDYCVAQLELLLKQRTPASDVACMVLEPVLGEGGYVPCPPAFARAARTICDRHGILLVIDEVQTGFGRTGKYFATERLFGPAEVGDVGGDASGGAAGGGADLRPDVLIMAKGLASGFPLSAIASRRELMDCQPPGSMGGTYAGNAVACAAAAETQRVIRDERLVDNSCAMGARLVDGLRTLAEAVGGESVVRDVRGHGCMVGMELNARFPPGTAKAITQACAARDLLLLNCSVYETVRFIPPLNVTAAEIDECLEKFEGALRSVVASA